MKNLFKKLFCKHNYEKIDFIEALDNFTNVRYSIRIYQCTKCGKEIEVDGRYDKYES